MTNYLHFENTDIGVDFQDEGPWRSYHLTTYGETLRECLDNASIAEVDQDGGDLRCYGIDDASGEVYNAVLNLVTKSLLTGEV